MQLAVNPNPQISFRGDTPQPFIPQSVHRARITLPQVENPALALVKFHTVGDYRMVVAVFPLSVI